MRATQGFGCKLALFGIVLMRVAFQAAGEDSNAAELSFIKVEVSARTASNCWVSDHAVLELWLKDEDQGDHNYEPLSVHEASLRKLDTFTT